MGLKIILRTGQDTSPFRRAIQRLVSLPGGTSALLCSGYIWETHKYSLLDDGLLDSLRRGLTTGRLITVAGKFHPNTWQQHYDRFLRHLHREGIPFDAYWTPTKNWHAKIAMRLDGTGPLAAVIGSSNLTRPAYGENVESFNYECDVVIWRREAAVSAYWRDTHDYGMIQDNTPFSIAAVMNPRVRQPDEVVRMRQLYAQVMDGVQPYEEWRL